jgi:pimeloyl-ACP methyl ester carboxylesterase
VTWDTGTGIGRSARALAASVVRVSTPRSLRPPAVAQARTLDTARGPFAVYDAAPDRDPDGPTPATALLVPGFTGSKEDWLPVLEPLTATGYRVIALDQRGQYETPGPADAAAYDLGELGRDLFAVADAAGAGRVHLVGLAVRAAAIASPAAVASVTLLCSGPGPIPEYEAGRARQLIRALERHGVDEIWAFTYERAKAAGEYDGVPAEIVDFMGRRFRASAPAGLAAMARHLVGVADLTAELAATGLPVLVAHGADDFIWPQAEQADMAARLGARYEILAGAAHSPAVQAPAATAALLAGFWAGTDAAAHARGTDAGARSA